MIKHRLGLLLLLSCCLFCLVRTGRPVLAAGSVTNCQAIVADRIVFNWHNFLSSCSTWNPADWNRWTDEALKLGYNGIMVHAYGNNPMVSFAFDGRTKPVGFLSTTVKGRDWSTMHVSDVRRLFGGSVFDQPVFGADAAQVPDEQRVKAARKLMKGVFAHAAGRGMNVFFANDVDTGSANPQDLILALPESARFATQANAGGLSGVSGAGNRRFWLGNPDTPEGYRYYKAQVAALMGDYPQITTLVAWFRTGGTPWMDLKLSEMPAGWQEEYKAVVARSPQVAQRRQHNMLAIGKIVRAYERALKESGHERVRLAAGTWNFGFMPGADLFFPPGVTFIGLDYDVLHNNSILATAERRRTLAEVGAHRPLIPVVWAQHDDGAYIGRPFTPFSAFGTKLAESGASGFGVIHWTTRPMDLFMASHARQVFEQTRDEPLRETCAQVGGKALGEYLYRWITEAPQFGRETSDYFIDRPLKGVPAVVAGCRERLALLRGATGGQADYFRGLEEFVASFYETHDLFQRSQAALGSNDLALARQLIGQCHPGPVIEQFAKFSSIGGITRGEQGLIVSLNLRWLTHIIRHRQALGIEPVRIKFGPTQHDMLAQSRGKFTFYFDTDRKVWEVWGEQECGSRTFVNHDADVELGRTGIEIAKPQSFTIRPIMAVDSRNTGRPASLPAGTYRLSLFATAEGAFSVTVAGEEHRIEPSRRAGFAFPVTLAKPGSVDVTVTPASGIVRLCGVVLECVE